MSTDTTKPTFTGDPPPDAAPLSTTGDAPPPSTPYPTVTRRRRSDREELKDEVVASRARLLMELETFRSRAGNEIAALKNELASAAARIAVLDASRCWFCRLRAWWRG